MPEISETLKGSFTMFFGTVRQKIFDGKSWYPPPLIHKVFRYRKFLKHSREGFPCEIFRHCETKKFSTENRATPSLPPPPYSNINFFATGIEFFWKTAPKGSSTKCFGTVRQRFSTKNRDITLWSIKLFDTRNFLKHQRVPLRSFSVLWDKTTLRENRDTRPLSYP